MPVFVLRIVLCVALVLNGMGDVLASTRMQLMTHAGEAPAVATAAAPSPCHVPPADASHAPPELPDGHGDHGGPDTPPVDCCSSGPACACECAHAAAAMLPLPARVGALAPASPEPMAIASLQIAPALRQLIRPPIG